jgi:DnaJ-class molecular chaperone
VDEFLIKEVVVPRGAQEKHLIFFEGAGNENLDIKAADMIVRIHILDHQVFTRDGDDLLIAVNISLKEALFGFNRTITHLNGTSIDIIHDDITSPGQEFTWEGMGMPIISEESEDVGGRSSGKDDGKNDGNGKDDGSSVDFGNLIMSVHVVLPERLKDHQTQAFRSALNGDG